MTEHGEETRQPIFLESFLRGVADRIPDRAELPAGRRVWERVLIGLRDRNDGARDHRAELTRMSLGCPRQPQQIIELLPVLAEDGQSRNASQYATAANTRIGHH